MSAAFVLSLFIVGGLSLGYTSLLSTPLAAVVGRVQALRGDSTASKAAAAQPSTVRVPLCEPFNERSEVSVPAFDDTVLLPGECFRVVQERTQLTGNPPLLCRADILDPADGGGREGRDCAVLSFGIVDPPLPNTWDYHGLNFVTKTEDAIKDIFLAILGSPGQTGPSGAVNTKVSTGLCTRDVYVYVTHYPQFCKASPVTWPYNCLASVIGTNPRLFKARNLWVMDIGSQESYCG
jgi:hypothetical protein